MSSLTLRIVTEVKITLFPILLVVHFRHTKTIQSVTSNIKKMLSQVNYTHESTTSTVRQRNLRIVKLHNIYNSLKFDMVICLSAWAIYLDSSLSQCSYYVSQYFLIFIYVNNNWIGKRYPLQNLHS